MGTKESPSLLNRFESPHPQLPNPSSFMRLLSKIIGILLSAVSCLRHQFSMSNAITA